MSMHEGTTTTLEHIYIGHLSRRLDRVLGWNSTNEENNKKKAITITFSKQAMQSVSLLATAAERLLFRPLNCYLPLLL